MAYYITPSGSGSPFRGASPAIKGEPTMLGWLIPLLLAGVGLFNRAKAAETLEEDVMTPEQVRGSVIQDFANRGMAIAPNSPLVQEALRRQSLAKRQAKAQQVLAGPDPLSLLFGVFSQH